MRCDGCSLIPTHNLQTKLTTQKNANLSANLSSASNGCMSSSEKDPSLPNGQADDNRGQNKFKTLRRSKGRRTKRRTYPKLLLAKFISL